MNQSSKSELTVEDIIEKVIYDWNIADMLGTNEDVALDKAVTNAKTALLPLALSCLPYYFASPDKDEYSRGFNSAIAEGEKRIKESFA